MKMRLLFTLVTLCVISTTMRLHAQNLKFHCNNETLEQILHSIESQSSYNFVYSDEDMAKSKKLTLHFNSIDATKLIDTIMSMEPFSYTIVNNVVSLKYQLSNKITTNGDATITGIVYGENNQILPAASVVLEPTNRGLLTNGTGSFEFKDLEEGDYKIVVNFLNYYPYSQILHIGETNQVLKIQLKPVDNALEEVNVISSNGYQTISKERSAGSYVTLTSKDIENSPSINLMERLEGKVAGVEFDPKDNTIRIHGKHGLSTDASSGDDMPLIVVDGFPLLNQNLATDPQNIMANALTPNGNVNSNAFQSVINPNDIASITFLKDAAAASIWGSRAANGVIVITTKSGKAGKQSISLSSTVTVSNPSNLNNLNRMSPSQYLDVEKEAADGGLITDPYSYWRYQNPTKGWAVYWQQKDGMISGAEAQAAYDELSGVNNYGQIKKYLLQKAITQQYNFSVSGGNENNTYYLSGNYANNRPVFKSNYSTQYSLNSRFKNMFFNKRLTFNTGINIQYGDSKENNAAVTALKGSSTYGLRPYDQLVNSDGTPFEFAVDYKNNILDSLQNLGQYSWYYSPINELKYGNQRYKTTVTRVVEDVNLKLTSWADFDLSGTFQRSNVDRTYLQETDSYYTRVKLNQATSIQNGKLVYGIPNGDILNVAHQSVDDYTVRAKFDFHKNWKGIHSLTGLVSSEIRQNSGNGFQQYRYGYNPMTNTNSVVNPTTPYTTMFGYTSTLGYNDGQLNVTRNRWLSYLGNVGYSYKGKYDLNASFRFDDYNMVGISRSKRAKPFWSMGAKWNVLQESFVHLPRWINGLDVRATMGTTGSIPSGFISPLTVISYMTNDYYTGLPNATIGTPGNQDLTWQEKKTYNIGLDFSLFQSRISGSFDWFHDNNTGLVAPVNINSALGWSTLSYNTATMTNHGWDLNLNFVPVRSRDWTAELAVNLSEAYDKVTDNRFASNVLYSVPPNGSYVKGYSVNQIYAYNWGGLDNQGRPQVKDGNGNVINVDGSTGSFSVDDYKKIGRSVAPIFGGIMPSVRYKQFSLSARAVMYFDYWVQRNTVSTSDYPANASSFTGVLSSNAMLVDRWRKPGDETTTNIPGLFNQNFNSLTRYTNADINYFRGDNIRLQQLTFSYQLSADLLKKLRAFSSASCSFSANNIGLIWKKNNLGLDPTYQFTNDFTSLKPPVNYSLNVNVTF